MVFVGNEEGQKSDFIDVAVPDGARLPRLSLTMAWWALATAAFFIVVAPLLAQFHGVPNVLVGMGLSVLLLMVIGSILSRYAVRTGASVAVLSVQLFGTAGAAISTLILFATTLYYAVFEGSVVAIGASFLAPSLDLRIALLIVAVYSVLFVLGPIQNWLDRLNGFLLPIYAIGLGALIVLALDRGALFAIDWSVQGLSLTGVISVFSAYMGLWILPMCTFDFARFGRKADIHYHARFNFGLPFYLVTILLNGFAGILLVASTGVKGGVSEVSVVQDVIRLLGIWGLLFLWATQTRINTANYYLAAVNFAGLFRLLTGRQVKHVAAVVIVGILAYLLMLGNVMSYLLVALAYQGIFVVAWVAIAFVHALHGAPSATDETASPAFRFGGLASWFAGVGAGIGVHVLGGHIAYFAPLASALIAGGVYAIYRKWPGRALANSVVV